VLGFSFLVEGGVLILAITSMRRQAAGMPFWRYVREKADPAALAILLEDGAAVLGLVLATAGILLAWLTGNPVFDALASITVGVLLGIIAMVLVVENRTLLLGRAVPAEVQQRFLERVRVRGSIADIHDVKTRQLTPEAFQFKAEIRFSEEFVSARLAEALPAQGLPLAGEARTRALQELSRHLIRALSEEVDAIEAEVRAAIPEAKHIDLELEHVPLHSASEASARQVS
jgi:zinc transporter 9